ncbi:toxin [Mycolicibacterium chitae]|uniref:Toxin n=2 Tax=Mycobacteriaceae TaxID=1762 RepID=A0A448HW29_MYCCI|nr:toxin [Mycolicibacterium chitae]VEG44116.1 toxin [Mycolicibacterium chitae]
MRPGDVAPRLDTEHELYVAVLSNSMHLTANTGRVITCPFIPGEIPADTMAMVVATERPRGVVVPELVQWLPVVALDAPIGNIGADAVHETKTVLTALL